MSISLFHSTLDFSQALNILAENELYDGTVWAVACKGVHTYILTTFDNNFCYTQHNTLIVNNKPRLDKSFKINKEDITAVKFNWAKTRLIISLKKRKKLKFSPAELANSIQDIQSVFAKLGFDLK